MYRQEDKSRLTYFTRLNSNFHSVARIMAFPWGFEYPQLRSSYLGLPRGIRYVVHLVKEIAKALYVSHMPDTMRYVHNHTYVTRTRYLYNFISFMYKLTCIGAPYPVLPIKIQSVFSLSAVGGKKYGLSQCSRNIVPIFSSQLLLINIRT